MIEVVAIPILIKAVDFLFEEGSKILQERRERRKDDQDAKKSDRESSVIQPASKVQDTSIAQSVESTAAQATDGVKTPGIIKSKETAMSTPVDEVAWKNSKTEVEHSISLLEVYTKNYHLAKEQYAKFGSALVPPIIVHNLTEAEDGIATTTENLQTVLSKVYGKEIVVPGSRRA